MYLNYANCGSDENNQIVKKLKEELKSKDKELCETRRQRDENKDENCRLNKTIQMLETDLKSLHTKFDDVVLCKLRLTSERDSLSGELETKYRQLCDLKAQYDKDINDQKCSYDSLFKTLTEVNKSSAQNHYKLKDQNQKLQNEICAKKDELCSLKKKMKELERENDCNVNVLKTKLVEKECSLKRMALISDNILKIMKCGGCCCPEKKIEDQSTCPVNPQPICCTEDPCCSQQNPCTEPINQKCITIANVAADGCNVPPASTDIKKIVCQVEQIRNDLNALLKPEQ